MNTNLLNSTNSVESGKQSVPFKKVVTSVLGLVEYPFDINFEGELIALMEKNKISNDVIPEYLKYVQAKTVSMNPIRSMIGLYYKLAKSQSVVSDFLLSLNSKKVCIANTLTKQVQSTEPCPVCGFIHAVKDYACPQCHTTRDTLKENPNALKVDRAVWQLRQNNPSAAYEYDIACHKIMEAYPASEWLRNPATKKAYNSALAKVVRQYLGVELSSDNA